MENCTYWVENGKYQEDMDKLNKLIPNMGYTDNKYFNAFIIASKLYYDVYNNGGWNILDCYMDDVDDFLKDFSDNIKAININVTSKTLIKNLKNHEKLEKFMDEVIAFVKNNDFSFERFVIYQHYDKKQLSKTKLDNFNEVSFGSKKLYCGWVNCRLNDWGFELV